MTKFLGAALSAAGLLVAVASGVASADPCRYGCYDLCQDRFPGSGDTFERYACYRDCDNTCAGGGGVASGL